MLTEMLKGVVNVHQQLSLLIYFSSLKDNYNKEKVKNDFILEEAKVKKDMRKNINKA